MTDRPISDRHYVVATVKPWNIDAFHQHTSDLPGNWHLLAEKDALDIELLRSIDPRYVFFPHWSWLVPLEILQAFECVCLHMTDVPYGRGGSPLQNLIERGHKDTVLTALKMVEELDSGPIYKKVDLDLRGSALSIYERAASMSYELIRYIIENNPDPVPQEGEVVKFKRRTEEQSRLPEHGNIMALYDHIRMLDAPTYPRAMIEYGDYVLEFSEAELKGEQCLEAKVTISCAKRDAPCPE